MSRGKPHVTKVIVSVTCFSGYGCNKCNGEETPLTTASSWNPVTLQVVTTYFSRCNCSCDVACNWLWVIRLQEQIKLEEVHYKSVRLGHLFPAL
jgi:hypothetical protein